MEHCLFCQADLEPGTQCCRQCGQIQPVPFTEAPTGPRATVPLLSPAAARLQDKRPDSPPQEVDVPDKGSETPEAQDTNQKEQLAIHALPAASVDAQEQRPDPPAQGVLVPDKGSGTPEAQMSEGEPGAPIGATEVLTQRCLGVQGSVN